MSSSITQLLKVSLGYLRSCLRTNQYPFSSVLSLGNSRDKFQGFLHTKELLYHWVIFLSLWISLNQIASALFCWQESPNPVCNSSPLYSNAYIISPTAYCWGAQKVIYVVKSHDFKYCLDSDISQMYISSPINCSLSHLVSISRLLIPFYHHVFLGKKNMTQWVSLVTYRSEGEGLLSEAWVPYLRKCLFHSQ